MTFIKLKTIKKAIIALEERKQSPSIFLHICLRLHAFRTDLCAVHLKPTNFPPTFGKKLLEAGQLAVGGQTIFIPGQHLLFLLQDGASRIVGSTLSGIDQRYLVQAVVQALINKN